VSLNFVDYGGFTREERSHIGKKNHICAFLEFYYSFYWFKLLLEPKDI